MFRNCTRLVGGAGTKYDGIHIDKTYARIDGGPDNPGYLTDINKKDEVCDADDLQHWLDNLGKASDPAEMVLCDEPTFDEDVDVDDLQIWIDGTNQDPQPVIGFYGGTINIHPKAGMSFKSVSFASKDMSAATLRGAGNVGGIKNSGTLKFERCTFLSGDYTIENSGNASVGEGVTGCRLVNKTGGRVSITGPLTDNLTVVIPTEADVEAGTPIITGVSSADHILMTLPAGYAYKYDATGGGIVVYSTTGITTIEQHPTVKDIYDLTGRKADNSSEGLRILRLSNGEIRKQVLTNNN